MNSIYASLRGAGLFLLTCLLSLIVFGLVLTLFSVLPWPELFSLRLWTVVFSAGAAFLAGGMLAAWFNPQRALVRSAAFGLLLGGFSFFYIFGISLAALLAILLATLLALAGGWLVGERGNR